MDDMLLWKAVGRCAFCKLHGSAKGLCMIAEEKFKKKLYRNYRNTYCNAMLFFSLKPSIVQLLLLLT
ncbi:hypothetical protein T09_15023 [Trichinella sp. T9]|uniref:Uncharacterized protein n=1 Tax=Trichinella murrelli TaxID=144512 RepID=A0A0V0TZ62_9BILA|nr:hypothetical protein T05_2109 [Trichinella murrelli]KRX55526.1 hypothetical protein T09_15023 [Trichinella sp. T9]